MGRVSLLPCQGPCGHPDWPGMLSHFSCPASGRVPEVYVFENVLVRDRGPAVWGSLWASIHLPSLGRWSNLQIAAQVQDDLTSGQHR